jgi:hypothetical protein
MVTANGATALRVPFRVTIPTGGDRVEVEAVPGVAINDGSYLEREPPVAAGRPTVLGWILGGQTVESASLQIEGEGIHECAVLVSVPPDTAVAVDLSLRSSS